jgi:hypothetical protein
MIFCAHLKRTSMNTYESKKTFSIKAVKKNVMSNIYFPLVLRYSRQELLHCLMAQEIRGSNRLNVPNNIMFTFPYSHPPGTTSAILYTGWSNFLYITEGSTPRLAHTSSQKHPLNLHLWVPNKNT